MTNVLPCGFEHTVGVCHLGHFLPTLRLLPRLLAARGRVVMVSSESAATPCSRGSRARPASREANDPAVAARLWELSERWVGL